MKIVFLVFNFVPHQIVSIKAIIKNYKCEVHAFSFEIFSEDVKNIEGLFPYEFKNFSRNEVLQKIILIQPKLVAVAGWFIKDFVWVAKQIRKLNQFPIVAYTDTQWSNSWRQFVNCLISPFHLKKAFSHLWVAGIYQFEYAKKLGFSKEQIIYNSLSCDMDLFESVSIESKNVSYPKNFIFIGRFVYVKGLSFLIDAWNQIFDKNGWTLTLIGDGPLKTYFKPSDNLIIKDFMNQSSIIQELDLSGCFILPSIFEPWALVIHEAVTAGLPVIATEVCGAAPHFVINQFNGFTVKPKDSHTLKIAMEKIISMSDEELIQFCKNSRKLAQNITPELGAANLMSLVDININN